MGPGKVGVVRFCSPAGKGEYRVRLLKRDFALWPDRDGCLAGLVAVDLGAAPGEYPLTVLADGREVATRTLRVAAVDYGERRITVDRKFQELTPAQLARHQGEMARQRAVYEAFTPQRLWQGPWLRPVEGEVVGPFGRRSVINGEPRSPHAGVDLRAGAGVPVKAMAAGRRPWWRTPTSEGWWCSWTTARAWCQPTATFRRPRCVRARR